MSCPDVESLWSLAKKNAQKLLLLEKNREMDQAQFNEVVLEAFQMVTAEQVAGVLNANRRYLRELIKKAAVLE